MKTTRKDIKEINDLEEKEKNLTRRNRKGERIRRKTILEINEGIQGDSIEVMLERIREGEGEDSIQDRDLVYNDNESNTVNPITNIRTDKFETMLEEKIGKQEHEKKKIQRTKDAEEERKQKEKEAESSLETPKNTGTENPE